MNPQHTPGGWQVSHWYSDAGRSCGVSNGIQGVAAVYGIGREEAEANARLITAAPELLEALESIIWAEDKQPDHRADAIRHARAAIAKATGSAA